MNKIQEYQNQQTNSNNFSSLIEQPNGIATHSTAVDIARATKEVEAKIIMAKKFPRVESQAYQRLMNTCSRSNFAASGMYAYRKGGTQVEGPSIRFAEAAARAWGNIESGWREINRTKGNSLVEAYAWDLETNYRATLEFTVPHSNYSKSKGNTPLENDRDIYEKIANQAARRERKCILKCIPEDVIEDAIVRMNEALKSDIGDIKKKIRSMISSFKEIGISESQLEKRVGNKLAACSSTQIIQLGKIFMSIKDGASKASDWFETEEIEVKKKTVSKKSSKTPMAQDAENEVKVMSSQLDKLVMEAQEKLTDGQFKNLMAKVKDGNADEMKRSIDVIYTVLEDASKQG
jgi:hypothetical protein